MAIEYLKDILLPPKSPVGVPTDRDWQDVQEKLGTRLPDSLFEFCNVYGMRTIRGAEATRMRVVTTAAK